ncbi:GntR family transcriptional regulator [Actinoplanes sp. NPDC026619]|uniref:GntR family transcriptional regulator n=1 Tax=Actinoplanes sp. NPDC026619 TaxID=3155798 RepID=UPI0033C9947C
MEPQPTGLVAPLQLQIADDLRMKIERGDLAPGDPLPTLQDICDDYDCAINTARNAIRLLKEQGLITGGRGKAPVVRVPAARVCRSSDRHQQEKDLVLQPEEIRAATGVAETDMGSKIGDLSFATEYEQILPSARLAADLGITQETTVLRRTYEMRDRRDGRRLSWSVSYIPLPLIEMQPALLDKNNEPWPGGTQHQLYTAGIEVMRVDDQVSASMPTTAEAHEWRLDVGVPMLRVRRISYDGRGKIVELSDADFPADRTELSFTSNLAKWQ